MGGGVVLLDAGDEAAGGDRGEEAVLDERHADR
jgi:hypothetical protein